MIEPAALIAQAREWVGVRFLHQGRTRFGADCLGFVAAMLAELGSSVFLDHLPKNYGRNPQAILIEGLEGLSRAIALEPGVLVLIQFPHANYPSHAGIYTGESLVHAFQREGKVVEHSFTGPWLKYAVSYWALPLVMYQ